MRSDSLAKNRRWFASKAVLLVASLLTVAPGCVVMEGVPTLARRPHQISFTQVATFGAEESERLVDLLEPEELAPPPLQPNSNAEKLPTPTRSAVGSSIDSGLRPIGAVTINTAAKPPEKKIEGGVDLPKDLAAAWFRQEGQRCDVSEEFRPWSAYGQLTVSSGFCHRPLYFEDVALERYGRSHGMAQPFISAGKFFATVPLLPYKMVQQPPGVCQLDDAQPAGTPMPRSGRGGLLEVDATLVEVATIAAIILIFP
jgi:hypothetical protein